MVNPKDGPPGDNKSRQRSKARRRDRSGPRSVPKAPPSPQARARNILREFDEWAREMSEEYGLTRGERFPIDELVIPVTVAFNSWGEDDRKATLAEQLAKQYRTRVQDAMTAMTAFHMGRVYCFQCDKPDCVHSTPNDYAETFAGYTPTGKPAWGSFPNLCMERGDERVDRLYGDSPQVIAFAQSARELKGELLPGFGSDSLTYSVLGQVVAGLVPADLGQSRDPSHRVALILQLVETRTGRRNRRLRLNLLGLSADEIGALAADGSHRSPALRLAETMRVTRQKLGSLGAKVARLEREGRSLELEDEVQPILTRLRGDLERMFRPHRGKTAHAKERHFEGDRPTSLARTDAQRAGDERLLRDTHGNTVVVIGPKGRAHVFNRDGRHVTSLQLDSGELDRKTNKKRWVPLSPEDITDFRTKLAQVSPSPTPRS